MLQILGVTAPYFALILCGYAASWRGLMPENSAKAINAFVLNFALPALIIRTIGDVPLEEALKPGFLAAWATVSVLIFGGVFLAAALLFRQPGASATIQSAASAHGNVGYLGITLVVVLMGEAAVAPVAMAMMFDMVIVVPAVIALMESFGAGGSGGGVGKIIRATVFNPFVLAIVGGLGLSVSGVTLPGPADDFLRILGMAAVPAALFAIGVTLYGQPMRAAAGELAGVCAVKLLIHPFVMVFVATSDIFGLTRDEIAAAVMLAALPVANNVFILATRYETRPNRISGAILFSTAMALISFNLWAWLLLTR